MSRIETDTDYDKLEDDLFPPNFDSSARSSNAKSSRSSAKNQSDTRHDRNPSGGDISVGSGFSRSEDFRKMIDEENKSTFENEQDKEEIYIVKQRYGYLSIIFSLGQTIVLITMMSSCGVAPLNINPMVGPYPDALSEWGGKNAVNILDDGEWWRLLTPIMLHAGIIHLLCNVAVQLETGAFFEREWGSGPWLIIYLVSGVGSSVLSVIIMPNAVSVGSSGSVMGLFGGKLAEILCRHCESDKTEQAKIGHQVRKEQCAGVSCSVVVVLLFSFIPYVDWAAHLGGLIAGLCIGIVVFSVGIKTPIWRMFWFLVGMTLTTVYFVVALTHMYSGQVEPAEELRDVCAYYTENFEDYECNCMREENGQ